MAKTTRKRTTAAGGGMDRRSFLERVGAGGAATMALGAASLAALPQRAEASEIGTPGSTRKAEAYRIRRDAAMLAFRRPDPVHSGNGEEADYPYVASFAKGLPHDALGEVDPQAYRLLLHALATGDASDFEAVPLGGAAKLRNPQAGLAFDLEGPDCHHMALRPAPRIDGPECSAEMAELYWMALARDIGFSDYDSDPLVAEACADLSRFSDFRGPRRGGSVAPDTLFRGSTGGDLAGPYVSQFLLRRIPYGSLTIDQRQATALPGIDHITDFATWLGIQRGAAPASGDARDPVSRYIRNGRDLAAYVHVDALYEAYLNAALILLALGAPLDPGNPYNGSRKTDAFATFGGPHVLSLVTEVATRALKGVWFQKWYVHRRLRPEEFGGRVHGRITGSEPGLPIDSEILDSAAVARTFSRQGTYLLPQAFPEGAPLHPAYGSGHATVAGACVTILKAWFDESFVLEDPVVAGGDGTSLVPYRGPGALTVGGELDKVAANIASGRNFAGIHWRTDFTEGVRLGEQIAIDILEEQQATYRERASFTLTKLDGTTITIGPA